MKRMKGWRKPANTVYVGRPTKWGNPYRMGPDTDARTSVARYREWLSGKRRLDIDPPTKAEIKTALRGKNLACWCKAGAPCHGDILLKIANS
jgi:hypothetical protein